MRDIRASDGEACRGKLPCARRPAMGDGPVGGDLTHRHKQRERALRRTTARCDGTPAKSRHRWVLHGR